MDILGMKGGTDKETNTGVPQIGRVYISQNHTRQGRRRVQRANKKGERDQR